MYNPFDRGARTAPSHYPRIPFHLLRAGQLVSSLIVGGIMIYFIYHLTHDKWATPWTFIWLTSASLFSIAALALTIVLHCCVGLNPRFNLALNGFLLLLWTLSWCLLTWYMRPTLAHVCDVEHWHENIGIMVCRIYKALFTFTLMGFLSTAGAFILDIFVYRRQNRRGMYKLHDIDTKRPDATRGPFTDANDGIAEALPRESEAWEVPRDGPSGQHAYAVPESQNDYDTGYHGRGNGRV